MRINSGTRPLVTAVAIVITLAVAAAWVDDPSWAVVLDNTHWTLAFACSAWWAHQAARHAPADTHQWLQALALGAWLILLGQLIWVVQVALGYPYFPGPSDVAFLAAAGVWIVAWLQRMAQQLPPPQRHVTLLDAVGTLSALTAVVLTLYLPSQGTASLLTLVSLAAYPTLFLLAAGLAAISAWVLLPRASTAPVAVVLSILTYAASWMHWNLLSLRDALVPGAWHNASYSMAALAFGWGVRHWQHAAAAQPSPQSTRILAYLPLVTMTLSIGLLVHLFVQAEPHWLAAQHVVFVSCLAALLLVMWRQTYALDLSLTLQSTQEALLRSEENLYRLTNLDPLTQCPNRRWLHERLQLMVAEAQRTRTRIAVLVLDLDHFRHVNDTLGHASGDRMLQEVARRLQQRIGEQDILARLGADEFVVVREWASSRTEVAALAQGMLDALQQPWAPNGSGEHIIRASVGISFYPDDAASADELLQHADSALFEAKTNGRNTFRFYLQAYTAVIQRKLALRNRMQLSPIRSLFALHYQPQVDAQERMVGVEALLRWIGTEDGKVTPDEFIGIAEDSGFISTLGDWVLEEACQQMARWQEQGHPALRMSINLSVRQLGDASLADRFAAIALASGIEPTRLTLEVTESQNLPDWALPVLERLHEKGFELSLDDFGTGHSSLVRLKAMPLQELKIDKTFVRDLPQDPHCRSIGMAVNALARTLDLQVVAEGVETREQFDCLRDMGCTRFQGWLWSPALPPEQIPWHFA
jgi:diguanylate cyclase (GGDEF)-like protein